MIIEKPERIDKHTIGCILVYKSKYLLGLRTKDNLWGSIAGNVKANETTQETVLRKLKAELNLELEPTFFRTAYFDYTGEGNVAYNMFEYEFKEDPSEKIKINKKDVLEFGFFSLQDALKLNLFEDEDYCLKLHAKEL